MTQDQTVRRFVESAEAFCSLVERHQLLTSEQFIRKSAVLLASLYKSVWELPNAETKGPEIAGQSGRKAESSKGLVRNWGALGPIGMFLTRLKNINLYLGLW
jgi:hypothetical protein